MTAITKSNKSAWVPAISSGDTDTGNSLRAEVSRVPPHSLAFYASCLGADTVFSGVLWGHFDPAFFLGVGGYIALLGILGNIAYAKDTRKAILSEISADEKIDLAKAERGIGLKTKLAILFRRPIKEIILFSETDKYKMAHKQAELVRQNGRYLIKIETVNALNTWDLALDSVIPEQVREAIAHAAIARDAKHHADKIREERLKREMWRWERRKELYHQEQMGTIVKEDDDYFYADFDEFGRIV